jgi:hypothetical protein
MRHNSADTRCQGFSLPEAPSLAVVDILASQESGVSLYEIGVFLKNEKACPHTEQCGRQGTAHDGELGRLRTFRICAQFGTDDSRAADAS